MHKSVCFSSSAFGSASHRQCASLQCTSSVAKSSKNLIVCKSKPSSVQEVLSFAQQQFLQEIAKDDACINLAKTCLVIALEEEAAAQVESLSPNDRTSATAATWSLTRLDGLAAEVLDRFNAQLANDSNSMDSSSNSNSSSGNPSTDFATTPPPSYNESRSNSRSNSSSNSSSSSRTLSIPPAASATVQAFPLQLLIAVNEVLFQRHGYAACNRYGSASDSQLAAVLEQGPGSCAALTVLYVEVCSRLGLPLAFKVLDEGRYCLAWPADRQQQQLMMAAGEQVVVDVYGRGGLLTVTEVTELFDISQEELFAGSSRRELLSALLAEIQHAHWCAAVGCSPKPAFMTSLTARTAVAQHVQTLNGCEIERATAAAQKRGALLPQDLTVQLQLALLLYFSGRYEDAWLELGSYIEGFKAMQQQQQQQGSEASGAPQDLTAQPLEAAAVGEAAVDLSKAMKLSEEITSTSSSVRATAPRPDTDVLHDVLLLFEKLQLELMMASASPST